MALQVAVSQITAQLVNYAATMGHSLIARGGALQLPGRVRIPDSGLSPVQPITGESPNRRPRFLVEVEFKNRNLPVADIFRRE